MTQASVTPEHNFVRKHIDDEHVEYCLNGESLILATHEDDGWEGMERIEALIRGIANLLGADVKEVDVD